MARLDRVPCKDRVLQALKAGDMDATELKRRLQVRSRSRVIVVLHELERDGRVAQISPASGAEASRWTLRRGSA